jgi:hypothetical protein
MIHTIVDEVRSSFSKNTILQLLSFYYTRAVVKIQVENPLVKITRRKDVIYHLKSLSVVGFCQRVCLSRFGLTFAIHPCSILPCSTLRALLKLRAFVRTREVRIFSQTWVTAYLYAWPRVQLFRHIAKPTRRLLKLIHSFSPLPRWVLVVLGRQTRLDTCSGHHSPEQALDTPIMMSFVIVDARV